MVNVNVGSDIVLYVKDANIYTNIDNMVELINIVNTNTNEVVYNNNNNGFYCNDNNGVLTIPNVVTGTYTYRLTFNNKNNNGRNKTVNILINGVS